MPATQAQLHEARKKLTDNGVSIVAIGEILLHLDYFGIKPEYTKIDLEIALINEIINAWNGKGYNKGNIEKLINSNAHEIDNILKRVKDIKDNGTAATSISVITANAYFKNTRGSEFIRVWEQQVQATEAELETTKTAKAAAEASLKDYKEKLGSKTPEQLNKRPDTAQEVLNNAGKNEITTLTQDFKNECQRILDAWKNLILEKWSTPGWKDWTNWMEANSDRVGKDPFLLSFKDKTFEEVSYMAKQIKTFYSDSSDKGINTQLNKVFQEADNAKAGYDINLLRLWFFKIIAENADKWDNTAKLAELAQYKEQAGGKTPDQLKAELDSLKKRPDITPEDFQKLKDNQFKHPDDQLEKPKPEDSKISDQKKGPFLTYLHTRPVFSKLYKEIKELNSNVDLLYVTDDKNEFLKNLSEHRFNFLLWESKDGYWSVLWTYYRDKFDYYTDTTELEFRQEEAQIKKFFKGESFENQFFHWGPGNSAEGKTKQGFAAVAIETILKRIKDDPKLAMSEKEKKNDLKLLENSADIAQKEYDVYLEQLNQKIAQVQVATK